MGLASVKTFRVTGELPMGRVRTIFNREIRALKGEDAVERVFKELGSRHGVKRGRIKILKVEELREELGEVGERAGG